jgi:hypothetical protein
LLHRSVSLKLGGAGCFADAKPKMRAAVSCHLLTCCDRSKQSQCWNLVHVAHLVNSKACTIIVPYCQDKEMLPCLNMGVSYHSKIDACERKGDC